MRMQSNSEPAKPYGRLYPELSPEQKVAFLEDFKDAVKAGAVKLAPGNTISPDHPTK